MSVPYHRCMKCAACGHSLVPHKKGAAFCYSNGCRCQAHICPAWRQLVASYAWSYRRREHRATNVGRRGSRPPTPRCLVCGAAPSDGLGPRHRTSLGLAVAHGEVAQALARAGAAVTSQTDESITAAVRTRQRVEPALAILLILMCIIPGLIYIAMVNNRVDESTVYIRFVDDEGSTVISWSGRGPAVLGPRHERFNCYRRRSWQPSNEG